MHRLDENTLITPLLLKRFQAEGEFGGADGRHFALLQRSNGEFIAHDTHGPEPGPIARIFAMDILMALNSKLNFGGAWVLVFTHHIEPQPPFAFGRYDRFVLMWMDEDGDVQFPMEWEGSVESAGDLGLDRWLNEAADAHAQWKWAHAVLDTKPNEKFKRAQGQPRPSVH